MDPSRNDDYKADITNTEQNSKREDGDVSDDDEIRQMEEQLEKKRHEKKQKKLKQREEMHKQRIRTENSDLNFLGKETEITNKEQDTKGEDDDLSDGNDIRRMLQLKRMRAAEEKQYKLAQKMTNK